MSETTQGPGTDLRTTREGLNVTVREVAEALNLPTRVIEALEADDYERLPPSVFTRGYLRSYARLLELSPDELLARYPEVTEEIEAVSEERTGVHPVVSGSRALLIPAVVGGLILIALLVWLLGGEDGAEPAPGPAPAERTAPEAGGERPAEPNGDGRVDIPSAVEPEVSADFESQDSADFESRDSADIEPRPVSDVPPPGATVPATEAAPAVTPEVVPSEVNAAPTRAPDLTVRERRITELGDDRLEFRFSEDCWVEVKNLEGENLYSDLNRAGRTLVLTGRGPFRVLLGYAPGVSLAFNDEPVDLARHSRNNVASLVLGR